MSAISVVVKDDLPSHGTIAIEVKEEGPDGPDTIAYLEITRVPNGVAIDGWHGDDSPCDDQMLLRKDPA